MSRTPRLYARTAGILYLVTHVTSVTAVAAYASGALAVGVALELALAIGCLGTGILVWLLLRHTGPARSAAFGMLRAVEAAVILAGTLPMVALLLLSAPSASATEVLTSAHAASFLVGQGLVIGVNTVILGWLLFTSRAVPRALAVLGVAGGAIVFTSDLGQLFGVVPLNGPVAAACAAPIFAFELWFAVLLIVKGLTPVPAAPSTPALLTPRG